MQGKRFSDCDVQERLLYSAFLILMGLGYLMALSYLYIVHQGHDGKPGLSVDDVVYTYYGNRSGTRLEAAVRGSMGGFLETKERHYIVAWLKSGAIQSEYETRISPIIEKRCLQCHAGESGGHNNEGPPDLSSYEAVHKLSDIDTGLSISSLLRVSHIHLFGIGLVLFAVGMIFRRAEMAGWLKSTLILLPYVAVFVDISAWFLTKWDPYYATTVVIAGGVLGAALSAQILISLYQLWFSRKQSN